MAAGEIEVKGSAEAGKPPLLGPTLSANKGNVTGIDVFGCQSFVANKKQSKAMSSSDRG